MYMDKNGKIMVSALLKEASIVKYSHTSSSEINCILKEKARAIYDEKKEYLRVVIEK